MPANVYEPTVIGVVENEEFVGTRTLRIRLTDGRELTIDLSNATAVGGYP